MWDSNTNNCEACQCDGRLKRVTASYMESNRSLDKENLSPERHQDLSFYAPNSPNQPNCSSTSPNHCSHDVKRQLDYFDTSSQDSGYGAIYNAEAGRFSSFASPSRSSRASFSSAADDDFFEDIADIEPLEDNLPCNFKKLINGSLVNTQNKRVLQERNSPNNNIRPLFRRALSLQTDQDTPNSSRARSLFKDGNVKAFKRPDPPSETDIQILMKKSRILEEDDDENMEESSPVKRPIFQRAMSATEESIKCALQRSSTEPDLIGDFSRAYSLPLVQGRHSDLKSITPSTLAQLMRGEFRDIITSFKVIDCRYPYEFEGGHISGAINIYTKDQCLELLENSQLKESSNERHILVFHCEFSSERGPNLFRFLRKEDRQKNEESYPSLHYPEVYLLEGGYKKFFGEYSDLCVPVAYKEMLHPEHENDLRFFRQKSKTWNADSRYRPQRGNLKRLL